MVDITKCTQELCPSSSHCYRRIAPDSQYWQSMAAFEYKIMADGVRCEYYLPVYMTTTSANTEREEG